MSLGPDTAPNGMARFDLWAKRGDPALQKPGFLWIASDDAGPDVGRVAMCGPEGGVLVWRELMLSGGQGPAPTFGLVNRSSIVSAAQAETMASALRVQLSQHVPPLWPSFRPPTVRVVTDENEFDGAPLLWPIVLQDGPIPVGPVGGFHDYSGDPGVPGPPIEPFPYPGRPYAVVTTSLSAGGVFSGPFPVSFIASHEALEMALNNWNPLSLVQARGFITCCAFLPGFTTSAEGAPFFTQSALQEICDPVGPRGYVINVGGTIVPLCSFVSQQYFSEPYALGLAGVPGFPIPPAGTLWDFYGFAGFPGGVTGPYDLSFGELGFLCIPTSAEGLRIDVAPFNASYQNPVFAPGFVCTDPPGPPPNTCFPAPAGPPYTVPVGEARVAIAPPQFSEYVSRMGAFALDAPGALSAPTEALKRGGGPFVLARPKGIAWSSTFKRPELLKGPACHPTRASLELLRQMVRPPAGQPSAAARVVSASSPSPVPAPALAHEHTDPSTPGAPRPKRGRRR